MKTDWSNAAMSELQFWRIIGLLNWKRLGDDDEVLEPAVVALSQMPVESIRRFDDILAEKLFMLDTMEHAENIGEDAYAENEYFSADYFLYARCVPVANGQSFYETVLADPSTMPKDCEFESILYLASFAYTRKTGEEYDYGAPTSYETGSNAKGWQKRAG